MCLLWRLGRPAAVELDGELIARDLICSAAISSDALEGRSDAESGQRSVLCRSGDVVRVWSATTGQTHGRGLATVGPERLPDSGRTGVAQRRAATCISAAGCSSGCHVWPPSVGLRKWFSRRGPPRD